VAGLLLLVAVVGLAVAGCQGSQAPAPAAGVQAVGSLTARLRAEADQLMLQQEYDRAAVKYQAALNETPADVSLRYTFAVALSYLPRREETIEQFRIVVLRGGTGSPEVQAAREWLANAGALGPGEAGTASVARQPTTQAETAAPAPKSKVSGKLHWREINPHDKLVRVKIRLTGDDVETREVDLGRDFMLGRGYEFRDLTPGAYRLVAEVAGTTMWDLKVAVPADKPTTLDLTEGNSSVSGDYDPPAAD
jgi:hypothetical protein